MNANEEKSPVDEESKLMGGDLDQELEAECSSSPIPDPVQSHALTQLDDLGLEEVSDTDAPQLSQCNSPSTKQSLENGELDPEKDDLINLCTITNPNVNNDETVNCNKSEKLFDNLEALETETISDNDELSLVDDDNMEEGEIPHEQQQRTEVTQNENEVSSMPHQAFVAEINTSFTQEGEYEEGEIVEENISLEIIEPVIEPPVVQTSKGEDIESNKENEVHLVDIERENQEKISQNLSLFRKSSKNVLEHNYRGRSEEENVSFRHSSRSRESDLEIESKKKHKTKHKSTFVAKNEERRKTKKTEGRHENVKKSRKEDKRMGKDEYGRDVSLRRLNKTKSKRDIGGRSRRRSRSFSRKSRKRKFSRSYSRSRKKRRNTRRRSYSSSSFSSSRSRSPSPVHHTRGSPSPVHHTRGSPVHRSRGKKHKDHKKSKSDTRSKKHRGKSKQYGSDNETIAQIIEVLEKKKESKKDYFKDHTDYNDGTHVEKKKKGKSTGSLLSKEVYQTGGNIMVSVNFPCDSGVKPINTVEGAKIDKPPVSVSEPWGNEERETIQSGQLTPLQDEPMWVPRADETPISNSRPEVVDDIILVTPPTPDPITISDSDEEHRAYRSQPNTGAGRTQGPKTPPPPSIRFAVMSKPSLKSSSNPMFHAGEEEEFHSLQPPPPPNTSNEILPPLPPPPNWSPPSTSKLDNQHQRNEPNSYDPFQPTKSPSPSAPSPASTSPAHNTHMNNSTNDEDIVYTEENEAISPRKPGLPFLHKQNSDMSIQSLNLGDNLSKLDVMSQNKRQNSNYTISGSPDKKVTHTLEAPQNINYAALTSVGNYVLEERRRSTSTSDGANTLAIPMETDSPLSPDSSDISDFFEPPSPRKTTNNYKSNREHLSSKSQSARHKPPDQRKFENLFNNVKSKNPAAGLKNNSSKSVKPQQFKEKKFDEDYIPRSAVDLQKVQRQERIAEEVKITLKPFFNKKIINKDEYKDIMRKSVMKVCQSKSGEINPAKIRLLVDAYIKRVRYYSKQKPPSTSSNPPHFIQTTLPNFN